MTVQDRWHRKCRIVSLGRKRKGKKVKKEWRKRGYLGKRKGRRIEERKEGSERKGKGNLKGTEYSELLS